jgi:hypothetical protein
MYVVKNPLDKIKPLEWIHFILDISSMSYNICLTPHVSMHLFL